MKSIRARLMLPLLAMGVGLAVLLGSWGGAVAPASAQQVAVDDLETLAKSIKDDTKRAELLGQIRALIKVARGDAQADDVSQSLGPRLITALSESAAEASRQLVTTVNRFTDVPILLDWIRAQATEEKARNAWLLALFKLAIIVAVGFAAERFGRFLLDKPRRSVEAYVTESVVTRLPVLLARTVLDVLPVAAFAVAAYAMLPLVNPGAKAQVMVVTFLQAYLLSRALFILMRMLLVPAVQTLRVLPLSGETANYLFIWSRRLISVSVFGYFLADAAYFLGLPSGGRTGLLRVVALTVTAMIVVFILQNRPNVSAWLHEKIKRGGDVTTRGAKYLRWAADIWHVPTVIYVVGAFLVWALNVEGGFEYLFRATLVSVFILIFAKLVSLGLRRAVERGFAVRPEVRMRFPTLEARVNRYVPVIHLVLRSVLVVIVAFAVLQAWGVDVFDGLNSDAGRRFIGGAFSIGFVVVIALIVWEAVSSAIERYLSRTDAEGNLIERGARARTLLPLLRNVIMIVLSVMVALIVLAEIGINIGPLLAGAGVIGLAIGFGSQKLVQDIITGVFILFEDTISVGDVVTAGGLTGVVERLSIRTIRLRDLSGNVFTVPFSSVDTVTNMTKDFSMAVIEAGVAYRENVDDVMAELEKIGAEMCDDPEWGPFILEPLEVLGVDALADSAVIIKVRFKTVAMKQWAVRRQFNRRMKNRFDELGIEIPFPHRTMYFGVDKDGGAPPVNVRSEKKPTKRRAKKKQKPEAKPDAEAELLLDRVDLPSGGEPGN
ncbi:MAG: mechanosensitive ion channel [Rhodospirillales bacterium]|nr:mechanosensitive ion channel [Rhodospirillales bacterium]